MSATSATPAAAPASPGAPGRQSVQAARRAVRRGIWRVRCENRPVSRYVFNLRPVLAHRRDRAQAPLRPETAATAARLERDGVTVAPLAGLLGDPAPFEAAAARAEQLAAAAPGADDPSRSSMKSFLHQLLGATPEIDPADPLVALALHPQVLGVAEAYSGMRLRLLDLNVWLTHPTTEGPSQSQRWHRDLPEDHDIVKCFVYVRDVPVGAGPLQYIRGSNGVGARRRRWTTEYDGIGYRVADSEVAERVAPDDVVTAEGVRGDAAFADTRGLHRGGHATTTSRLVIMITYASAATTRISTLRAAPGVPAGALDRVRLAPGRARTAA